MVYILEFNPYNLPKRLAVMTGVCYPIPPTSIREVQTRDSPRGFESAWSTLLYDRHKTLPWKSRQARAPHKLASDIQMCALEQMHLYAHTLICLF